MRKRYQYTYVVMNEGLWHENRLWVGRARRRKTSRALGREGRVWGRRNGGVHGASSRKMKVPKYDYVKTEHDEVIGMVRY